MKKTNVRESQEQAYLFDEVATKAKVKALLPGDEPAAALYFNLVCFFHKKMRKITKSIGTAATLGYFLSESNRSKSSYYYKSLKRLASVGLVELDADGNMSIPITDEMFVTGRWPDDAQEVKAVNEPKAVEPVSLPSSSEQKLRATVAPERINYIIKCFVNNGLKHMDYSRAGQENIMLADIAKVFEYFYSMLPREERLSYEQCEKFVRQACSAYEKKKEQQQKIEKEQQQENGNE